MSDELTLPDLFLMIGTKTVDISELGRNPWTKKLEKHILNKGTNLFEEYFRCSACMPSRPKDLFSARDFIASEISKLSTLTKF